jgi:dihydroorotate dehydrogenase (NAD+) catalytic subunit
LEWRSIRKPCSPASVHQCARAVSIPVIASGGASTAADVIEYMLAGATAVQIGTASFVHPTAMPRAIAGLADYCSRKGIARLRDLIGAVRLEPEILEGSRVYA